MRELSINSGVEFRNAQAEMHQFRALFIAYAPADKPKIALVIVENSGFGARAAAPIAREVFDYYLLGKEVKPVKDDDDAPAH